jgi:hypothetical protein
VEPDGPEQLHALRARAAQSQTLGILNVSLALEVEVEEQQPRSLPRRLGLRLRLHRAQHATFRRRTSGHRPPRWHSQSQDGPRSRISPPSPTMDSISFMRRSMTLDRRGAP